MNNSKDNVGSNSKNNVKNNAKNNVKNNGRRYCQTCSQRLQKYGFTSTGRQRWYCRNCKNSGIRLRSDLTKQYHTERFNKWLSGKQSQTEVASSHGISSRTFRRQIEANWKTTPPLIVTGEVYDVIVLDAIFINGSACLILRNLEYVVYWQWAEKESVVTWSEVLAKIPEPQVVVCDGHGGVLLAIAKIWPRTRLQRCLTHVERNLKQNLGMPQRHPAGALLMQHWRKVWQITAYDKAELWEQEFNVLKLRFHFAIYEFNIAYDAQGHRRRKYLYPNLKTAYLQIDRLLKQKQLFTYLELSDLSAPRTTNLVEGGINAQIRFKLIYHRGLPKEHQRTMVDWYLYSLTEQFLVVGCGRPTRGGL
jgi:transposase-like protein